MVLVSQVPTCLCHGSLLQYLSVMDLCTGLSKVFFETNTIHQIEKIRIASSEETCRFALNDARNGWEVRPAYQGSVLEAKNRGLSIGDCRKELGIPAAELLTLLAPEIAPVVNTPAKSSFKPEKLRHALIIGNANYRDLSPLTAPQRDAHALTAALKALGFQVTELIDADQTDMRRALATFGSELRTDSEAGLFYFSGYSVQVAGKNFLLPIDTKIENADGLKWQAIAFDDVLSTVGNSKAPTKIIVLESGWDVRLPQAITGIVSGLAPVVAPAGSLVSFSNAPGRAPPFTSQSNSNYTAALVEALSTSGLTIEEVFKRARASVSKTSENSAVPWETNALISEFAFNP